MKKMKKFACLILAVVMVFALAASASAENGSITINNLVPGQVYNAYRVLDLESYKAEFGAYAYKVDSASPWYGFVTGVGATSLGFDAQGYVHWIGEESDAAYAAFAKEAVAYAKANSIQPDATVDSVTEGQTCVVLNDLPLGYFVLDSSLGTLCILNTTNPDATVEEKNIAPTVDKEVMEDSTGVYGETNDAELGETVYYQTTITAGAGAQKYTLHDNLTGLSFVEVTGITLNGDAVASDAYTVNTENLADDCDFEVAFSDSFCDSLAVGDEIVVSYTATVNEDAVIAGDGNPNETWLSYSEMPNTTTEIASTITYVWDFNVVKYTTYLCTEDNCIKEALLPGAEFVIYREYTDLGVTGLEYAVMAANGRFSHWTRNEEEATTLISDENGTFAVPGLDSGAYWLKETKAPQGYNKLTEPIKVIIKNNGNVTDGNEIVQAHKTIRVENKTGALLPATGGMGTTLFYVLGGVLVLAAVVLLVTRKRMSVEG